jgi:ABC-type multidrug transport system fused ATPase/permease subunit
LQQKQTDILPQVQAGALNNRIAWRQLIQLREENKRLRWFLAEAGRDEESLTGHQDQPQEIEQYREQIQELLVEREHLQEAYHELEYRYQNLYHSFQSQVEEEAQRMVEEAARTIDFAPVGKTGSFKDAMKTVELYVRQVQDKHTAESLYLMRQAQRKAAKLEQELAQEREQIDLERQNLHTLQASAREQAELRKRIIEERLRLQYTVMTTFFLLLLPILQLVTFSFMHMSLTLQIALALFAPLLICMVLFAIFSYISARLITTGTPKKGAAQNKEQGKKGQDKKEEKKKTA